MIPAPPDLLVIGGLAIDRFPDGSEAPGGSVVHAARALAMSGLRAAMITVAGPEDVAVAGVRKLRSFGELLVHGAPRSICFSIDERCLPRTIVYEAGAHLPITAAEVASLSAGSVLIAPIAGELDAAAVAATAGVNVRTAALQGWLRVLVPGKPVAGRSLGSLGDELTRALRAMTALVASHEDLAAEAPHASGALAVLRDWAGPGPVLIVTAGAAGVLLDVPGRGRVSVPAPRLVDEVPTVGAGDAFAALFAARIGRGLGPVVSAQKAAAGVSRWLALRAGARDS